MYAFAKTTPQLRACSLCNRLSHTNYEITLGDTMFLFCSVAHANQGMTNYETNKHLIGLDKTDLTTDREDIQTDAITTSSNDQIE